MGILDGLEPIQHREPCRVGKLVLELEPDDQKVLLAALEDDRWTSRALAMALNGRGITIAKLVDKMTDCERAGDHKGAKEVLSDDL